jgi:hypothetical protein
LEKFTAKIFLFFYQKLPYYYHTYPWGYIKDFHATEEAFSPEKIEHPALSRESREKKTKCG